MDNINLKEDEFIVKGKLIYKRLRPNLESKLKGKILAIEVETGGYVVGKDELDAIVKAKKKFPGKIFYFVRVGYPVVHKLRRG